jgi:hypothetical protein
MKETLTLELGRLQARILKIALGMAGQLRNCPLASLCTAATLLRRLSEMASAAKLLVSRKEVSLTR